jgi:pentatricopeptide repeat protein
MRDSGTAPSSIAVGCLLEAFAVNQQPERAHELVREMLADKELRPLVNAVCYSSVLKGYSRQKRFDRVLTVYEEMIAEGFKGEFTAQTYNTLLDACVRSGMTRRMGDILEDMAGQGIEATAVTHSVVLKGFCQNGDLERASSLVETMRQTKNAKPDEQAYNTLLDGYARQGRWTEGMQVLATMEAESVPPTNYTLSVLVKLATRSKRLDDAFKLCQEIPAKYHFKPNAYVIANLIQGCTIRGKLEVGFAVLEEHIVQGSRPNARCYQLLIQGYANARNAETAVGLLRAAFGLPNGDKRLAKHAVARLRCEGPQQPVLPLEFLREVIPCIGHLCQRPDLADDLLQDLKAVVLSARDFAALEKSVWRQRF